MSRKLLFLIACTFFQSLILPQAEAQNHIWNGTSDSNWSNWFNWGGAGIPGGFPGYGGTTGRLDLRSSTTAVYDPASAGWGNATTTFTEGRGIVIGNTTDGSLLISSGTIRLQNNQFNADYNPTMANYGNASLTINGSGRFDASGQVNDFIFYWEGASNHTSTLNVDGTQASFASTGFNLRRGNGGTATINISNGGTFTVDRLYRQGGTGANVINFDGGVLQAGSSHQDFLGITGTTNGSNLSSTTVNILSGGITIDTNGHHIGIGQSLLAGPGSTGGLTKTGLGSLTLSGANSYGGETIVAAGELIVTRNGALGSVAAGTTVLDGATLTLRNVSYSNNENLTLTGSGIDGSGALRGVQGNSRFDANISVNSATIGVQDGSTLTLRGNISGQNLTLMHGDSDVTQSGVIALQGANNGWTGVTDVHGNHGEVRLNRNDAISINSVLQVGKDQLVGGRVNLNGRHQTIQGISQSGNSTLGVITNDRPQTRNLTIANMQSDQTYHGQIAGQIALRMESPGGTQTLAGANTYSGTTTVSGGRLIVNGSHYGGGNYSIGSQGALAGHGVINSQVNVSGTIAAGDSINPIGNLTVRGLQLNSTSTLQYTFNSDAGTADLISVTTGQLQIADGANIEITNLGNSAFTSGTRLTLVSYNGMWDGGRFTWQGSLLENGAEIMIGANRWRLRYDDTIAGINFSAANSGATSFITLQVVPEPNALTLTFLGSLAVIGLNWRQRRNLSGKATK